jgi:anti-sigma regulatory factor (Ser/Thr protein kinase)/Na+-translocating ferredoxin:NAD+ oxidoreductase RNF subunit RnfB
MITMNCRISGGDFDTAGLATRRLKEQLARVGVGTSAMRRAMIAAYEAEMNVVIHARSGTLWARLDSGKLDLEVADEGPGIPDVELALREGWSTASEKARGMGFGAGMGLPNIRRNSDVFDIETRVGKGTRIRSTILLTESEDSAHAGDSFCSLSPVVKAKYCRKCLRCIFSCPARAIRISTSGPAVISALCVGCTECIGGCTAGVYGIAESEEFQPPPAEAVLIVPQGFISGTPLGGPDHVLAALESLGFAEIRVLEEWTAALRLEARDVAAAGNSPVPLIPPVCPAVTALVESRFPSLIPNLGPWLSPIEAAGEEFPMRPVFILAACPAQYTAVHSASFTERLTVLTIERVSSAVRGRVPSQFTAGGYELRAPRGLPERGPGELTVTGVQHVMKVLAAAETGSLSGIAILDLSLCDQGCMGSPLLSADPFLSTARWQQWRAGRNSEGRDSDAAAVRRSRPWARRPGIRLDPDMGTAIRALGRIENLAHRLPGRDCGACGAPSCALFAEDLVIGRAGSTGCPFVALPTEEIR